jgi:hypothetical protein
MRIAKMTFRQGAMALALLMLAAARAIATRGGGDLQSG